MYKYDVLTRDTPNRLHGQPLWITTWRVYTDYGNVKHYIAGFTSYKDMIASYPELHNYGMTQALPLLNSDIYHID